MSHNFNVLVENVEKMHLVNICIYNINIYNCSNIIITTLALLIFGRLEIQADTEVRRPKTYLCLYLLKLPDKSSFLTPVLSCDMAYMRALK